MTRSDSQAYLAKKRFFDSLLTVYGRKPVLEALQQPGVKVYRLHLAHSNKPSGIINELTALASSRGAEIVHHDRAGLSRISKNAKQDQGVAADLVCEGLTTLESFLNGPQQDRNFLALDGVTNPQNLGMIIRSACAGNIDGIILPSKGCAQIDPLVIKASAGTVFRASILRVPGRLHNALATCRDAGMNICGLSSHGKQHLKDYQTAGNSVFVLGNETDGVSKEAQALCTHWVKIPMNNGVESLNVAVTAALIAFR